MHMKLTQPIEASQPKSRADIAAARAAARETRCRDDVLRVALRIADGAIDHRVRRAELLRLLPHWTHSAIAKAMRRLADENLVSSVEWRESVTKSWAFELTSDGEHAARSLTPTQLAVIDEIVGRLRRRPERIDAALRAITSDDRTGGDC